MGAKWNFEACNGNHAWRSVLSSPLSFPSWSQYSKPCSFVALCRTYSKGSNPHELVRYTPKVRKKDILERLGSTSEHKISQQALPNFPLKSQEASSSNKWELPHVGPLTIQNERDWREGSESNTCRKITAKSEERSHETSHNFFLDAERFSEEDENVFEARHEGEVDEAGVKKEREAVRNMAIRLLARQSMTAFQLRKKLSAKNIPFHLIEYAIKDMQKCGLQSDLEFAKTYTCSRWTWNSWGPQRIKQALKVRGVDQANTDAALCHVFNNKDEGDNVVRSSDTCELSKSAWDHLLVESKKQWHRSRGVSEEKKIQRLVRWLQYRGFKWSVIQSILKVVRNQDPNESV